MDRWLLPEVTVLLGLLGMCACVFGEDCSICQNCSADPAFVQPDTRNMEKAELLRTLDPKIVPAESVGTVVLLEEKGCCGDGKPDQSVVVLVGSGGDTETLPVTGGKLDRVRAFLGSRERSHP